MPVTSELVDRGRDRYGIFCAPCHDATGSGRGMVVRRGFRAPASFHEQRLRDVPDGYFVDAMRNGFGAMASYRTQVRPGRSLGDHRVDPRAAVEPARAGLAPTSAERGRLEELRR